MGLRRNTPLNLDDDLILGSLWLLGRRDNSSVHTPEYWGNFVPQIPNQIMRRFTHPGEVVVDLFCGLGTTLIECRRLGRHGIGVELVSWVAQRAQELVEQAENPCGVRTIVLGGLDACEQATAQRVQEEIERLGFLNAHCLFLHPPYHDIIKFSDDPRDLSRAPTIKAFLERFSLAVENAVRLLAAGRHLALVIGDKYTKGEWVPLGFYCMEVCRRAGLRLKAINVKDIQGNERGKGRRTNLWRYRARRDGLYLFQHEYVMLFDKPVSPRALNKPPGPSAPL